MRSRAREVEGFFRTRAIRMTRTRKALTEIGMIGHQKHNQNEANPNHQNQDAVK